MATQHLEKPNPNEWAHKTVRSSRGRCMCQTRIDMHDCSGYQPRSDHVACRHLDEATTRCVFGDKK
jgi:hypothetical protein